MVKEFNVWGNKENIVYSFYNRISFEKGVKILDNYRVQSISFIEKVDRQLIKLINNMFCNSKL